MATFTIQKIYSEPQGSLAHYGQQIDVRVLTEEEAALLNLSEESSSSSVVSEVGVMSSSSSTAISLYDVKHLFLFNRKATGDKFLGVCSPLDLETWPVDAPTNATGYFRKSQVTVTTRHENITDTFIYKLSEDIDKLAAALNLLAILGNRESVTYDFSSSSNTSSSSSSNEKSFTVTKEVTVAYPSENPTGYRLQVNCTAIGADPKIFLHRNDLPDQNMEIKARPIAVCSPGDLVDYPPDEPDETDFPAHYRLAEFDVVSSNLDDLNSAWTNIKIEVARLAQVLKIHENEITDSSLEEITFDV